MSSNPFHDLYLSEAISEEALVEIFSPIIVDLAGAVFEPLRDDRQIIRIAAYDLCSVFQRIDAITKYGKSPAVFAPYGPKAQSVAMCLHALRYPAEVYFTQPTYYHPEYSTGIALKNGLPMGYSYLIRLDGADFY